MSKPGIIYKITNIKTGMIYISGRLARVKLPETGEASGWLTVVRSPPAVSVQGVKAQVEPWMPAVNDWVLVLFRPVENGEGYILGGI